MPKVKQITVIVEDRPGALGALAMALGEKGINLQAFTAIDDRSSVRIIVDKPSAAHKLFAKRGWRDAGDDIVQVIVPDKLGALGDVASKLGQAGVNIRYAYAGSARSATKVSLYLAVDDVNGALKALR